MKILTLISATSSGILFYGIHRLAVYAAPRCRMNASELEFADNISKSSQMIVNSGSYLYYTALFGGMFTILIFLTCLTPVIWREVNKFKLPYLSGLMTFVAAAILSVYSYAIYEFMFYSTDSLRAEYRGLEKTIEEMGHPEEVNQRRNK